MLAFCDSRREAVRRTSSCRKSRSVRNPRDSIRALKQSMLTPCSWGIDIWLTEVTTLHGDPYGFNGRSHLRLLERPSGFILEH